MTHHSMNTGDSVNVATRLSYGIEEAARALGLGRTTVYGLITNGTLKSIKVGNRRLIPAIALDAFFAAALEREAA